MKILENKEITVGHRNLGIINWKKRITSRRQMHHQELYMEYKENKAKGGQNLDLKKKQRK